MTTPLDGKVIAAGIRDAVRERAEALTASGVTPALAIVVPTDDGSTAWYVRSLARTAEKVGVRAVVRELGRSASEQEIRDTLGELAVDGTVHGVILQTPLPAGVAQAGLAPLIPVGKDVDGVNPLSLGSLVVGDEAFAPATAEAVMRILAHHDVALRGRRVTVIGRSTVVGKPVAHLLLNADATVTVAHSRTADLPAVAREADVLVVAVGRENLVTGDFVRPGAVVVDVGTNVDADGNLVGDVDAVSVQGVAGSLTPVPGGVGPVTSALLLDHTVTAAERAAK